MINTCIPSAVAVSLAICLVSAADLRGPSLTGVRAEYRIGQRINATCSSGPSSAKPALSWLINDKKPETERTEQSVELSRVNASSSLDIEVLTIHRGSSGRRAALRSAASCESPASWTLRSSANEPPRRSSHELLSTGYDPRTREEGVGPLGCRGTVIRGSGFWLNCSSPGAHSIRWFKDEQEFYRYPPTSATAKLSVPGRPRHGAICQTEGNVYVEQSDLDTEGTYTCKVKLGSFETRISEKRLQVYVLPEKAPEIQDLQSAYKLGGAINASCLSGPSRPAAIVTWHVDGLKVDAVERRQIPHGTRHRSTCWPGYSWSPSQTTQPTTERCTSGAWPKVGSEYTESSERLIEILHPQAWAGLYGSSSWVIESHWTSMLLAVILAATRL
uniref:Putative secreted protein n=2 Tax=Ixodes ricinus TaxID=34613 RepID=A0A090XEQ9_IXORI